MKKILTIICSIITVLTISTSVAFAVGDGNLNVGGGSLGTGNSKNFWSAGNDGVRITIIDVDTGRPAAQSVDFSRREQDNLNHFGKNSKIDYKSSALAPSMTPYSSYTISSEMPTIVSSNGNKSSIEAIKKYFCSEYTVKRIADVTGFDYDKLISGKYKLLIEPLAYFVYDGNYYCMTATEVALYDQKVNGHLRVQLLSVSHKNLPLALFLETADLGYSAWQGSKSVAASNSDIISYLGLGIVTFKEIDPNLEIDAPDVTYRVNTEVITSVTITTDTDLTPDNPATVTFYINGKTYTINNIVIPSGDSQVVWVKWTTPKEPQTLQIDVTVSGADTAKTDIIAEIVDLSELIPPDPLATDTNPDYILPALPKNSPTTTATWGVWDCYWVPVWVWCDHSTEEDPNDGHWVDEGYWEFDYTSYSASVGGKKELTPDDIVPTASGDEMKSGYGVKTTVTAKLETSAPSSHFTYPQTAFSVFPEFNYETYLRLLENTKKGKNALFEFSENDFSTYLRRVHFLPVWFLDNTDYIVYTEVWDTWTPAGMLTLELSDEVIINGSLFDDWYTNRE